MPKNFSNTFIAVHSLIYMLRTYLLKDDLKFSTTNFYINLCLYNSRQIMLEILRFLR